MNGPEAMDTVAISENATERIEVKVSQAASSLSKK
jgi:hypothetical protein